ncbi:MAG: nitroreductase [Pseudohongiellaceae bacterium]
MEALYALHNRTSIPKLSDPAPGESSLKNIFRAAFRAADHAVQRPWRFLVIRGDSRARLGELFACAAQSDNPEISAEKLQSLRLKPFRAPVIVVTISSYHYNPKVPEIEQDLSAGAATQNMLLAAFAQNIGAIWRTGPMAFNPVVREGLGLAANEKIIAFLYLGQISGATKRLPEPDIDAYFQNW